MHNLAIWDIKSVRVQSWHKLMTPKEHTFKTENLQCHYSHCFLEVRANIGWKPWATIKATYALEWLRLQIHRAITVEEEAECPIKWYNHFNKLVIS